MNSTTLTTLVGVRRLNRLPLLIQFLLLRVPLLQELRPVRSDGDGNALEASVSGMEFEERDGTCHDNIRVRGRRK